MKSRKWSRITGSEFSIHPLSLSFPYPRGYWVFWGLSFGYTRGYWVQLGLLRSEFSSHPILQQEKCFSPIQVKFTFLCIRTRIEEGNTSLTLRDERVGMWCTVESHQVLALCALVTLFALLPLLTFRARLTWSGLLERSCFDWLKPFACLRSSACLKCVACLRCFAYLKCLAYLKWFDCLKCFDCLRCLAYVLKVLCLFEELCLLEVLHTITFLNTLYRHRDLPVLPWCGNQTIPHTLSVLSKIKLWSTMRSV